MTTDKLSADIKELLERTSTQTFLRAAQQFVDLLEIDKINKITFYKKSHTALIDLYSAGYKLESIELKYSSADSKFDRDEIFENKNVGLISTLGYEAYYWEVFDPTYSEQNGEPNVEWTITDRDASQGWLVDDFADIYRDLKIELEKIDKIGTNEAVEDALWNLKWSFVHHWGNHCISALRALHHLWYDGKQTI